MRYQEEAGLPVAPGGMPGGREATAYDGLQAELEHLAQALDELERRLLPVLREHTSDPRLATVEASPGSPLADRVRGLAIQREKVTALLDRLDV